MTAPLCTFAVRHKPVCQGDMRGLGAGRPMVHKNAKQLKPYREAIAVVAAAAMHGKPIVESACVVYATFCLQKPKTVTRPYPTGHQDGDVDKLLRALLDAMSKVVYKDDALVQKSVPEKVWAGTEGALDEPGVIVMVAAA